MGQIPNGALVRHYRYSSSTEEKKAVDAYMKHQKKVDLFNSEFEWQGFKNDVRTLGIMGISLVSFIALGSWISEMGERKESTITAKRQ